MQLFRSGVSPTAQLNEFLKLSTTPITKIDNRLVGDRSIINICTLKRYLNFVYTKTVDSVEGAL